MLIVVGGHSRNIGKTSVIAGLIRRTRGQEWIALKITQYGNQVCSKTGDKCGCEPSTTDGREHPFTLSEEYEPSDTDSGRFLAAGAARSFWLRVPAGELAKAGDTVRKVLAQGSNVIVESNSILELVKPDLFLMLLDFSCEDFKSSSLQFMDRADAFLVIDRGINAPLWAGIAEGLWDTKPRFLIQPPRYVTPELVAFVNARRGAGCQAC